MPLDLADLRSVRGCADARRVDECPFDMAINNAGVMATPFGRAIDGFEPQFGTNHLAISFGQPTRSSIAPSRC